MAVARTVDRIFIIARLLFRFPRWAIWVPVGHDGWTAIRMASSRPPAGKLPTAWAHAPSSRELRRKMKMIDESIVHQPTLVYGRSLLLLAAASLSCKRAWRN